MQLAEGRNAGMSDSAFKVNAGDGAAKKKEIREKKGEKIIIKSGICTAFSEKTD